MIEAGATVAGHRVERLLGDNALTATWLVRAPPADGAGELRVLRTLQLFLPAYQQRFRRACEALVGVEHPHLVRVFELVDVDGIPGVLVEHLDGGHLGDWMAAGPHPPREIVRVLRGIVAGVDAAHRLGLLHRNLKPSVVRMSGGVAKVDDFALGKVTVADEGDPHLTQAGTTFGTPQYMAPEQFRGAQLTDERADLYAVGSLAYEMCTGRRAFDGTDVGALYAAVREGRCAPIGSVRPDLPAALVRLVEDLMRPDPDQRPDTARAVLDRIDGDPLMAALLAGGSVAGFDPHAATLPPTRALLEKVGVDAGAPTLPPTRAPFDEDTAPLSVPAGPAAGGAPGARTLAVVLAVGAVVLALVLAAVLAAG